MSRYVGYLFVCILWLFVPMGAWAVSKDKNPILIICSYNPAAHQTSVTISDYMEEYGKLGAPAALPVYSAASSSACLAFISSCIFCA